MTESPAESPTTGQARTGADESAALPERRLERLRLLPVLMIAATLMFGIKLGNIWQGADAFLEGIPEAMAQAAPETGDAADEEATESDAEAAPSETAASSPAEGEADSAAPYSRGELQLLQNLADRRSALDEREREIKMREKVLTAMEQRIDKKIAEVKRIEATISKYMEQHESRHQENVAKLIKVYESMEADEAARIFEQLEMDILLKVAGEIRETKMAEILSAMKPAAAKTLTVELATKDPLPLPAGVSAGE